MTIGLLQTCGLQEGSGHDDVPGPVDWSGQSHGAAFARGWEDLTQQDPDDRTEAEKAASGFEGNFILSDWSITA